MLQPSFLVCVFLDLLSLFQDCRAMNVTGVGGCQAGRAVFGSDVCFSDPRRHRSGVPDRRAGSSIFDKTRFLSINSATTSFIDAAPIRSLHLKRRRLPGCYKNK